jgi:putative NADH-flavin reductase
MALVCMLNMTSIHATQQPFQATAVIEAQGASHPSCKASAAAAFAAEHYAVVGGAASLPASATVPKLETHVFPAAYAAVAVLR